MQPLKDKVESMTENETHLRRLLDEANLLSEGYIKRIKELEAQRIALATDVATLEEEVEATRKHASERFQLAKQKQDIESRFEKLQEKYTEMSKDNSELKERAKLFNEISKKNHDLEHRIKAATEQIKGLEQTLANETKEKDELDQIRHLQDKAIHELYDNEKLLKKGLEKTTNEYSEYKMQMEAYKKKMEMNSVELK